jgi:hypothetical protein
LGHNCFLKSVYESFQTIVELNHGKVDNMSSENIKLLNLTALMPVYQLFRWYFK